MDHEDDVVRVGTSYPVDQLAKAFAAVLAAADPAAGERAMTRVRRWGQVVSGMLAGTLSIGSRAPVKGLPGWVTPEVVRGGFVTGSAAAAGPVGADELATAARVGVPADRRALFGYCLSREGLAELDEMLSLGTYQVEVPEDAVLLTVAWLLSAGETDAAVRLVEQVAPFADRLRFLPRRAEGRVTDASTVWRATAREASEALASRRPNQRVAAMREALSVWGPFGDELLGLWLETVEDGKVGRRIPDQWVERASGVLDRYRALASEHTMCSKHRNPKENLAILRSATERMVAGDEPERQWLLQHAVDSMVRRRGEPGSVQWTRVREQREAVLAAPVYDAMAGVLVRRLAGLPPHTGIADIEAVLGPVDVDEVRYGAPAGAPIPDALRRAVRRATAGTVEELMDRGVVPSAEVLARLIPQISASVVAAAHPDRRLQELVAQTYQAFRNRRSVLLLNLEKQIQFDELPWVQALAGRRSAQVLSEPARSTAIRVAELALQGFPGTSLPNPLVRELGALVREAGLDLPLVEELAADIFMGRFSPKFLHAAQLAAGLLAGSLYERYYGIDYQQVLAMPHPQGTGGRQAGDGLADLCAARAGVAGSRFSVAANGAVIEQVQILTTHNLAALVILGVDPDPGWADLARRSFATACRLVGRLPNNPRPLRTVKDAAYAWRNTLFFLSRMPEPEQRQFVTWAGAEVASRRPVDRDRLGILLTGLLAVLDGGSLDEETHGLRRFVGWATGPHWMLAKETPPGRS